ncbi:MAG: hypothetical protein HRS50_00935, partial [Mycoplasmataceae bacterium]|nr:hypothetical protein [Mycoplasmataceae bacterium]
MNFFKNVFKKGNKITGLLLILFSLLMLFSLIIFSWGYNPLYAIQTVTLLQLFGTGTTAVCWFFFIWIGIKYYLIININFFSKKRTAMMFITILLITWLLSIISIELTFKKPVDLKEYYNQTFFEPLNNLWINYSSWNKFDLKEIGIILPLIFWILGGWEY